ncbi:hypothetical protein D9M69_490470 [compost metagenome]
MGGGADQLHPALVGLVVGLGALEARQERVVDIDGTTGELFAQVVGEDLHVAGEHHQLAAGLLHQLQQRCFLLGLGVAGHRQVDEADALALGHGPQVQVVGDDGGDPHVHLALLVAVEQVGQAVVVLAHHQQHAHGLGGAVQGPLHLEAAGHRIEALFDFVDVALVLVVEAEHRAHEEAAAGVVVELRHLADVATLFRQVGGHRRNDAGRRRAADLEDVMAGGVLHVGSSIGGRQLIARRENCMGETGFRP